MIPIRTNYALGGALAFGIPALVLFGFSVDSPLPALICGVAGGLAYRPHARPVVLPVLLGICFALIQAMFTLQEAPSTFLNDVVLTGLTSAFVFWVVGGCATLALPPERRFNGAAAWAIPGGAAGMVFELMQGSGWEYCVLWLITGVGGGWLFGAQLDRVPQARRDRWGVTSVVCGVLGLGIGAVYFFRYELPLGLPNGFSPASYAADWLWSWGLLALVIGTIGIFVRKQKGRGWGAVGVVLAVILIVLSVRIGDVPWKAQFNSEYGRKLLAEHGKAGDPEYAYAMYTGNLILAQAALDNNDNAGAGRLLLEAAATPGLPALAQNGPDMSVAAALLQREDRETVIKYLRLCHRLWPEGVPVLNRWEAAVGNGRRVNFNNRVINPVPPDRVTFGQ